jgi:hypothetical protein
MTRRGAIADSYVAPSAGITIVQQTAGNTGAAADVPPFDASLTAPATAGNQILLAVASDATVATPSGFSLVKDRVNVNGLYLWAKIAAGGEQNISTTPGGTVASAWWVCETNGLALPALQTASTDTSPAGAGTGSTATTAATSGATNGLAVAVFGSTSTSGATRSASSMTNSFVEQADSCTTTAGNNLQIAVGFLTPSADGTFESTVTLSGAALSIGGIIAVFAHT